MAELNARRERLKKATAANIEDHEIYNIDSYVFVQGACPDTTHLNPIPKVWIENSAIVMIVKNKVIFLALIFGLKITINAVIRIITPNTIYAIVNLKKISNLSKNISLSTAALLNTTSKPTLY